jgi:hypothetical protein
MQTPQQFEQWVILELMGRQKIAGKATEAVVAGAGFIKIDVPETTRHPAFTRFVSPSSIYAINPVDEATARHQAERINEAPIQQWDVTEFMRKSNEKALTQVATSPYPKDEYEHEEEEEERED